MVGKVFEIAIFCGGFGTRMGGLTSNKQKCMLQVKGRPILEYLLDQISIVFERAKITLLVGYDNTSIQKYFGWRYKKLHLKYSSPSMKGTRLALLAAEEFIQGEDFLLVAGDTIIKGDELLNLTNAKSGKSLGILLISAKREIAPTHGLVTMENRRASKIEYSTGQSAFGRNVYSFTGTGFYTRAIFEKLKKYPTLNFSEVLVNTVKEGSIIEAEICATRWFHFGSPEDLKTKIEFED